MPLYSDYGMYYGGTGPYSSISPATSYSSASHYGPLYGGYSGRIMAPQYSNPHSFTSSRYTPMLSTITESPYSQRYSGISALTRINSPKLSLHSSPKYVAPRPIRVNTADIDVSKTRFNRSLPNITPSRITTDTACATVPKRSEEARPSTIDPTPSSPSPDTDLEPHYMPRCDQNDGPPACNNAIKRDRTIVRISTVRQKVPLEWPKSASETPVILLDNTAIGADQDAVKRTWRDNFGKDLVVKAREPIKKTPGELLLEKHLIRCDTQKNDPKVVVADDVDPVPAVMVKPRRPSFHDICQEISSDKIESLDDLNAGELRRRASLLPDDEEDEDEDVQSIPDFESIGDINPNQDHSRQASLQRPVVNKVTKSPSGTLHCLLERHLHKSLNSTESSAGAECDDDPPTMGSGRKNVKRVQHKITAKVHIDEPVGVRFKAVNNCKTSPPATHQSPTTTVNLPRENNHNRRQLNATLEHVSELHHHVNHVLLLPNIKAKKVKDPILENSQPTLSKSDEGEEDFWSTLGNPRESLDYSKRRRRQELLKTRLQTYNEDAEDPSQQFTESLPHELPQSTTTEKMKCPSWTSEPVDILCEVKKAETHKVVKNSNGTVDKVKARTKTTVAEKSERCENKMDLKIASDAVSKAAGDAKSPEVRRRSSSSLIDSHHEEEVLMSGGDDGARTKQTPASSIITSTTTTAAADGSGHLLDNPETQLPIETINEAASPKSLSNPHSRAVNENPSRGNDAQIGKLSTAKTTSKDDHQSIPGSLSKFATIEDLNLLSVDIDQPSSVDEMAIEMMAVCSRSSGQEPLTTASFSSSADSTSTEIISATKKIGAKKVAMAKTASTSSKSDSLSSQSLSKSPTPQSGDGHTEKGGHVVKKKRIIVKKVHKKSPNKIIIMPAEYSLSDVNIGNMSIVKSVDGGGLKECAKDRHENASGQQSETNLDGKEEEPESDKGGVAGDNDAPKETFQELMKRIKGKDAKPSSKFNPQRCMKFSPDGKTKLFTVDEKATRTLWATPRPLQKKPKKPMYYSSDDEEEDSSGESATSSSNESEDLQEKATPHPAEDLTLNLYGPKDKRMSSTCSNDSGFEGGTAPSSPKNMLGAHEPHRDSPSTPPSHNPAYKIDSNHSEKDDLDTSYTYAQFQRSGRITAPATSIPRFRKYTVEDFHFLAVLGKGSFGKVLLAELRNTEYYYAVKCLKKDVVLEDDDVECTLIERKVLALGTKHPYLCHLFCTFQTESHLFFVMEYLNGGDLMFHIQTSGRFPEPRARFYAAEIISGLKFLHKKGIVYRDLKLDNVLLDFDGHVRIADFGMCKLQIYLDRTADSFCGTPDYMAPEIIKGQKYNQTVDWWSFGVLLYEMLIGQSPFSGCDEDELFWSICNEVPWVPAYLSKDAANIVKALLEKDSSIRLGSSFCPLGDIADHRFFHFVNWQKLERREMEPPFKPAVRHPLDTQYFDKTFTKERVRLTPIQKEILHSMDQEQFQGFSYTNPNATLN